MAFISSQFSNSNGITFGTQTNIFGNIVTASHNGLTTQSGQAFSASGGSSAFQTLNFANSNGVTFSNSNGSVIASYTVPSVTNSSWTVSDNASSGTVAQLAFTNLNGVTLSLSTGAGGSHTIVGSHNALTSQSNQNALAANGNFNFQTISFSNVNGFSFATSAGSAIVGSYTVPSTAGLISAINFSAGTTSNNLTAITFSNSNGLAFGLNGSVVTGSYTTPVQTVQPGIQSIQVSNTTYTTGNVIFSNANGVSFGSSAGGAITASYTVPNVTNSSWTVSDNATSGTVARLAFTNLNGVTLSLSTGAAGLHTIVGSHNALTSQSNQNVTAANGGFAFQTLSFSNVNGFSFGTSAGSAITGSYTVPTQTNQNISLFALGNTTQNSSTVLNASNLSFNAIGSLTVGYSAGSIQFSAPNAITTARASTDAIGLNTAQTNVTWTVNSSGISFNAGGYAGTGTSATNASVTLNSNGLAISVASAVASPVNFSAGTTSNNLGSVVFSNLNGVSFGLNGSTITASVSPSGAGGVNIAASNTTFTAGTVVMSAQSGAITISSGAQSVMFQVPATSLLSATGKVSISTNGSTISIGAPNDYTYGYFDILTNIPIGPLALMSTGTNLVFPILLPNISFSRIDVPLFYSNATNSTGSHTGSVWIGIYTKNAATLSLLSSQSTSYGMSGSGTLNSSINAGLRLFTMGFTGTLTAGNYWLAQVFNSSSSSMNGTINLWANSGNAAAAQMGGIMGVATNNTNQLNLGFGLYSSSGYTMPNSMAFSQITGSVAGGFRMNKVIFNGSNIN